MWPLNSRIFIDYKLKKGQNMTTTEEIINRKGMLHAAILYFFSFTFVLCEIAIKTTKYSYKWLIWPLNVK